MVLGVRTKEPDARMLRKLQSDTQGHDHFAAMQHNNATLSFCRHASFLLDLTKHNHTVPCSCNSFWKRMNSNDHPYK